ncbi:Hypothetical_protein [Hexamita inflata]|uniref:Hypothetical_protein n=1 Tax=Hexamita inflata TaxID=28002 RepID=A0AA86NDK9_9EUKA|nr:Hypothetical protein HINF_LOCUS5200 [Hexamita inflata]
MKASLSPSSRNLCNQRRRKRQTIISELSIIRTPTNIIYENKLNYSHTNFVSVAMKYHIQRLLRKISVQNNISEQNRKHQQFETNNQVWVHLDLRFDFGIFTYYLIQLYIYSYFYSHPFLFRFTTSIFSLRAGRKRSRGPSGVSILDEAFDALKGLEQETELVRYILLELNIEHVNNIFYNNIQIAKLQLIEQYLQQIAFNK